MRIKEARNMNKTERNNYYKKYNKDHKIKSIKYMEKTRFGGLKPVVLQRDNFSCCVCEMTDREHLSKWGCHLTVDHIDGFGRYSEVKHQTLDNLWTLCYSCHGRRDRIRFLLTRGKQYPIELLDTLKL